MKISFVLLSLFAMLPASAIAESCVNLEAVVASHFDHGDDNAMYRYLLNFGEVNVSANSIIESLIRRPPGQVFTFGFIISADKPIYDFGPRGVHGLFESLPSPTFEMGVFNENGALLAKHRFDFKDLTLRDSSFKGAPSTFHAEFPGKYRSFAYLYDIAQLKILLSPDDSYCYRLSVIEPTDFPEGVRIFAVAVWPGWKQVTM